MAEQEIAGGEENESGEYEREPVPEGALLNFKSFIGMYAGEHCAGTELMIGPLFVAAGVSAFDAIFGLIVGNLLAVLSWMLLCAPIAVRARLTLYYQLEQICGRKLVTLYNLANGVMFCFLAGSMITVSATALGVWFDFPMPGLSDTLPNSFGWVVAVLVVGALISIVAALGYNMVARFANSIYQDIAPIRNLTDEIPKRKMRSYAHLRELEDAKAYKILSKSACRQYQTLLYANKKTQGLFPRSNEGLI